MARFLLLTAAGLVAGWVLLLAVLWRSSRRAAERVALQEAARLLPDVLRLLGRLAADRSLPRGVRWRLGLVLGYLAIPFDLVPDFVPVIGYADDVLVVVAGLRAVVRRAGDEALVRHWPGSTQGLATLRRLAGLHGVD